VDEFRQGIEEGLAEPKAEKPDREETEDEPGKCPECGRLNTEDARFCEGCGVGLFQTCPNPDCGKELRVGLDFCRYCGTSIEEEASYREHIARAEKLLQKSQYGRAEKEARLALKLRAEDKKAQALAQEASEKAKRLEELRRQTNRSLEQGGFDLAEERIRAALELAPQDEELLEKLRTLAQRWTESKITRCAELLDEHLAAKRWADVLARADEIIELAVNKKWEDGGPVQGILAQAKDLKHQATEQIEHCEQVLNKAHFLHNEHRYGEEIALLEELLASWPDAHRAQILLTKAREQRERVENALQVAEQAFDQGQTTKAGYNLRQVLAAWPEDPRAQALKKRLVPAQRAAARRRAIRVGIAAGVIAAVVAIVAVVFTVRDNRGHLSLSEQALAVGDWETVHRELSEARGLGVSEEAWQSGAQAIGGFVLARGDSLLKAGQWDAARRHYSQAERLGGAVASEAEKRTTVLEEQADQEIRGLQAEGLRLQQTGQFDDAVAMLRGIATVRPEAAPEVDNLVAGVQALAQRAVRIASLSRSIREAINEGTEASIQAAEQALVELAELDPENDMLAGLQDQLATARDELERQRQEERQRQQRITSLLSEIETAIGQGTEASLERAQNDLRDLKTLAPNHARIGSLEKSISTGLWQFHPVGTRAGQVATFEISPGVEMDFVWIPAGRFQMGSPESEPGRDRDEGPVHQVEITQGFWSGKYEVTQAQWQAVMGSNPSHFKGNTGRPAESVSWNYCQEFIGKLNEEAGREVFRLPTEAEWEYACCAGTTTPFHTGHCLSTEEANYNGNYPQEGCSKGEYREKTMRVGSLASNAWGLYDMHGNVWEWCHDRYGSDYYGSSRREDPEGPETGSLRVLRGGGWSSSARSCRSASRSDDSPGYRYRSFGLRLTRTAQ
ncbi:MAG: SUMF1/EgtB/PvdO family nonheme iron enzyme, partial [Candidatus Eisenbacteria sp.]|nr:SUMF1/EgtB/PvdO family nonheme iron enzyme [Candidatus Eisenbacteria bacterium]